MQELNKTIALQQLNFAQEILALLEQNENIIMVMRNEARFYFNGEVKKQNFWYWAD